ncbi:MAG: hypothetical protein JSW69_01575 [Deltaproteobacteria bacterium]|nr:MAG: hypothetical protein JSW69_01575 [Deltaproteobacteria bacterium]
MKKIFRHWKIIYGICCLLYIGWVIHVGGNEIDRINSQYSRLVEQLEPESIKSGALEELTAECRKEVPMRGERQEDACTSWPVNVMEAKAKEIEDHRIQARERGIIKLVLFYTGFAVLFLLGPPLFIYVIIAGSIKIYRSIKFVR